MDSRCEFDQDYQGEWNRAAIRAAAGAIARDLIRLRDALRHEKSIASGRARPLDDASLKPLADIPADIQAKLAGNERLMASLGLQATPAMVWRDANGAVQMRTGAPPSALPTVLGPR